MTHTSRTRRFLVCSVMTVSLLALLCFAGRAPQSRVAARAAAWPPPADSTTPAGKWYLLASGYRLELDVTSTATGFTASVRPEGGGPEPVSNISWNAGSRWFEFRRDGPGFFQWYRMSIVEGTAAGRFSHGTASAKPALTSYTSHVTGWSPDYLDSGSVPRTWNVTINNDFEGVLRIDRDSAGTLRGRLKVYDNNKVAGAQEELENDLTSISWNGTTLSFTRSAPGLTQVYTGTVSGRSISGTFSQNGAGAFPWRGTRGQVLGLGLGSRLSQRADWQARTRAALVNLTEAMRLANVAIPPVNVTEEACTGCPFLGGSYPAERDDNPSGWPANYTLKRLRFRVEPGSRFDPANPPPARIFYGYLATPTAPPPPGGYRAVVVVNGHGGSAQQLMSKDNGPFWYGESAARRLLIVLAVDIGHRGEWTYPGVTHPKIVGSGYTTSDWEEDGERAFSVRRVIDYLQSYPGVRADRIFIEGLSLGGEVATITAALDPRIVMATAAGYSPDMHVMDNYGNHPCYRWNNADIHEYVDVSDFEALIAPRPLVVETGLADGTFSPLATPWAADKQVTRRARRVRDRRGQADSLPALRRAQLSRRRSEPDEPGATAGRPGRQRHRAYGAGRHELANEQLDVRAEPFALSPHERIPPLDRPGSRTTPASEEPQSCLSMEMRSHEPPLPDFLPGRRIHPLADSTSGLLRLQVDGAEREQH
jgi:hypothetical protein